MEDFLRSEVQDWIRSHSGDDVRQLALKKNPFPEIPYPELLNQVSARDKCKTKLPLWFETSGIVYPAKLSVEQSSSKATAKFKASLVNGTSLFDATGGFGVDDFYFSQRFENVVHCELNEELSRIVSHNSRVLSAQYIETICADSTDFLEQTNRKFDCIYVDPSRRHESKGKVFRLSDCEPNVPELLPLYFGKTDVILVKTSPMLDISVGLEELENVAAIYVVALSGEVKELLWLIKRDFSGQSQLFTVNLESNTPDTIEWIDSGEASDIGPIQTYLFEPDAAIRKAGVFNEVAVKFKVSKLHRHTHLYTSDELVSGFPGRTFRIDSSEPYQKNVMKRLLAGKKANISVRNFPETVEELRKKWKISDGGNLYCFFTTNAANDKIVLLCSKIS